MTVTASLPGVPCAPGPPTSLAARRERGRRRGRAEPPAARGGSAAGWGRGRRADAATPRRHRARADAGPRAPWGRGVPHPATQSGALRAPTAASLSLSVRERGESSGAAGPWPGRDGGLSPARVWGAARAPQPRGPPTPPPAAHPRRLPSRRSGIAGRGGAGGGEGSCGQGDAWVRSWAQPASLCLSFPGRTGRRAAPRQTRRDSGVVLPPAGRGREAARRRKVGGAGISALGFETCKSLRGQCGFSSASPGGGWSSEWPQGWEKPGLGRALRIHFPCVYTHTLAPSRVHTKYETSSCPRAFVHTVPSSSAAFFPWFCVTPA